MTKSPEEIALEALAAIRSGDFENLKPLLSDNIVYEDPRLVRRGLGAIKALFEAERQAYTDREWDISGLTCEGASVVVERVDRFTMNGERYSLDVVATFEVNDAGKLESFVQSFDTARPI
ncbi:nuclear transport factor 2 family protein [Croceibacterium sp. LX-88]|uniref:Nuclear transport factor 2 family protein n=1 Tax=Croceibacterium selenioxidans TaxID=2838833 RepID=A0ABS5W6K7_9SPHN|nr:nuclear transport factor 2 family protein [Croceibacterium selenioxidans]